MLAVSQAKVFTGFCRDTENKSTAKSEIWKAKGTAQGRQTNVKCKEWAQQLKIVMSARHRCSQGSAETQEVM